MTMRSLGPRFSLQIAKPVIFLALLALGGCANRNVAPSRHRAKATATAPDESLRRQQQALVAQRQMLEADQASLNAQRAAFESQAAQVRAPEPESETDPIAMRRAAPRRAAPTHAQGSYAPSASVSTTPPQPKGQATAPPAATGDDKYNDVEDFKSHLKNGAFDYAVPKTMVADRSYPVVVRIRGYQNTNAPALPGATGTATLKVSHYMTVGLVAPSGDDEFTITPEGKTPAIQMVPDDGDATWIWSVKPKHPESQPQQLVITVYLVYDPANPTNNPSGIEPQYFPISVTVPSLWSVLRDQFAADPAGMFKYVLPGGAGYAAVVALLTWFWKRRSTAAPTHTDAADAT